ncbi:MAG: 3'-5' exonuclease, partial [Lachnospiraceae bacterium]|nr:3'-5' exonuclease [Lachnospiraceae bacterium]
TAHASKGLGYDNVIVVNGRNETYGFPSKIENDPVLSFVIREDHGIAYAEERRLFYVAMTRTKNRVYFIAPEQNPSEFLLELKRDYKNIVLRGEWNEDPAKQPYFRKNCPCCGYPLQLRYKASYGLRLYICTNEPEICGFMTNEIKAGKMSILKCDECIDGYLIIKPGRDRKGYMLGCTNYNRNGSGCRRTMSEAQFYDYMGIRDTGKLEYDAGNAVNESAGESAAQKSVSERNKTSEPISQGGQVKILPAQTEPVIYEGADLNVTVTAILQCLTDLSEIHFYDENVLADVLLGEDLKKLKRAGIDKIAGYGLLGNMKREDVLLIIGWLTEKGYIRNTGGKRPVLHPSYKGLHYSDYVTRKQLASLLRRLKGQNK